MIPRKRALIPVRHRASHWTPVSKQGYRRGTSDLVKRFGPMLRMAAPVFARMLGFSQAVQDQLLREAMPDMMDLVNKELMDDE